MSAADDLITPTQAAMLSGVPVKQVYKAARERLPSRLMVRRAGKLFLRPSVAVCLRIDHLLPKSVPVKVRKAIYLEVERDPNAEAIEHRAGLLSYVVDAASPRRQVGEEIAAYRQAMGLIVEDPEIQAGAATFKGTRILVHTVADLLNAGVSVEELQEDYPHLTAAMIAAAPIFARAHPRRGRPKAPGWRAGAPASTRRYKREAA